MLELDGVTAGYGLSTVLRDVSLTIPDSSVVALIGPNGAGKTTLLRVASGLVRPRAGRLLLDGDDVTGCSNYQLARAGICHVPEGHAVFGSLSVRENLLLFSPKGAEYESPGRHPWVGAQPKSKARGRTSRATGAARLTSAQSPRFPFSMRACQ